MKVMLTLATTSDADLLGRFIEDGHEDAFAELLHRYGPLVHGICRRALTNPADQDDAWQATFYLLARQARSIRQRSSLASWLHGTARRVCAYARRQAARRPQSLDQPTITTEPDAASLAEAREAAGILEEELTHLPQRYREPLILACLHGLPKAEIIHRLGLPPITITGRLARGKALLRRRLTRRGLTPSIAVGLLSGAATAHAWPTAITPSLLTAVTALRRGDTTALAPAPHSLMKGVLAMTAIHRAQWALVTLVLTLSLTLGATALLTPADAQDKPQAAQPEYSDPELARDHAALQGRWKLQCEISNNRVTPFDIADDQWVIFSGGDYGRDRRYGGDLLYATFKLEKHHEGKVIVLTAKDNAPKTETVRFMYSIVGDLVIMTSDAADPNVLRGRLGEANPKARTYVWQRVSASDIEARKVYTGGPSRLLASDQLRKLGLSMHDYFNARQSLPQAAIFDPNTGKPLLSWRVALLPFLGHADLYKEFKLDEPWDSSHNQKLLGKMPPIFLHPNGVSAIKDGLTHYQVFVSPARREAGKEYRFAPLFSLDPQFKLSLGRVTMADGLANTLMIVEARHPVPWTKPEDLMIEHDSAPLPALGVIPDRDDFLAVTAERRTRTYRHTLPNKEQAAKLLRLLIGYKDGSPVDLKPIMK
jgi:RNA polymerase sigma factor (sigma-70 family)